LAARFITNLTAIATAKGFQDVKTVVAPFASYVTDPEPAGQVSCRTARESRRISVRLAGVPGTYRNLLSLANLR